MRWIMRQDIPHNAQDMEAAIQAATSKCTCRVVTAQCCNDQRATNAISRGWAWSEGNDESCACVCGRACCVTLPGAPEWCDDASSGVHQRTLGSVYCYTALSAGACTANGTATSP